jgi:AcrR family transcriptional regulator
LSDSVSSSNTSCLVGGDLYHSAVPRLWTDTIEEHRREVRDAILDATARLVAERGLRGVTMSQIADEARIGRATLYKYFTDVEAILRAWHEREVNSHLDYLAELRDRPARPAERLRAVLEAYALISHESRGHHDGSLSAFLHQGEQVGHARRRLLAMVADLLGECVNAGEVRADIAPDELAGYCLSALEGASSLRSKAAVRRLVTVTMAGLRPDV